MNDAQALDTSSRRGPWRIVGALFIGALLIVTLSIPAVLVPSTRTGAMVAAALIAGAFAADTLGIPLAFNMLTILLIQFVAAGGAMVFAWLAGRLTTKGALTVALVGWILLVFVGVGVAPLAPAAGADFDYRLTYRPNEAAYLVESAPEVEDSRLETLWRGEGHAVEEGAMLDSEQARTLLQGVRQSEHSAYAISVDGGGLDGETGIGAHHPSNLADGPIDWWPRLLRERLWEPLGLDVGYQWLALGASVGLVLGGSQALARSLFAQITPEARSGEFFSFFGFVTRASAVFGPTLYVLVTAAFDTRVAVASIAAIILAGAIALRFVDVPAGARVAAAENRRRRAAPDG